MPLAIFTLVHRELVRFFRQRNRVMGALGQPLLFWLLFGFGLRGSFQPQAAAGASYMEYFFPGVLAMILLFTAIFSTISIIEDRREGFLQSVLVAPLPRSALIAGKLLGGTALAMLQGALFLPLALTQPGLSLNAHNVICLLGAMFLVSFALTGLGFVIAWRSESTQGYHAIMSICLFPMWLLSGAFFPDAGSPPLLHWIMQLNPLTYGVALLRHALYSGAERSGGAEEPGPGLALAVTLAFALATFLLSHAVAGRRVSGDLL